MTVPAVPDNILFMGGSSYLRTENANLGIPESVLGGVDTKYRTMEQMRTLAEKKVLKFAVAGEVLKLLATAAVIAGIVCICFVFPINVIGGALFVAAFAMAITGGVLSGKAKRLETQAEDAKKDFEITTRQTYEFYYRRRLEQQQAP